MLVSEEIKLPLKWLRRTYAWQIRFEANDFAEFQKVFTQITTDLYQWHQARQQKCAEVRLEGIIHPWIAGRIKEYLRNLQESQSHAFLRDIPFHVSLKDSSGENIEDGAPENS